MMQTLTPTDGPIIMLITQWEEMDLCNANLMRIDGLTIMQTCQDRMIILGLTFICRWNAVFVCSLSGPQYQLYKGLILCGCSNAALCQITLTTCYYYYCHYYNYWVTLQH